MSLSILTMRLIGFGFDVADGSGGVVRLLPLCGYALCFCGAIVGPQYSFDKYQAFVDGLLINSI